MPQWTPAQQAAIDDRGGALLVSAAAGSGKTAVLTERAVQLITDPDHPIEADRLLIVTFTNAAAAELRARIGAELLDRSTRDPGNARLRRQRVLLQRASICTTDAFCLELLRKYFAALDIPPDFTKADTGTIQLLRTASLSETLERAYADPDFCAFADLYGKGRSSREAGSAVLQVYDFLRSLPDYLQVLDELLAPWQQPDSFEKSRWHDLLMEEAQRRSEAALGLMQAALTDCKLDWADLLADCASAKDEKKINDRFAEPLERLERAVETLRQVNELAAAGQWSPLYELLAPYRSGERPTPGLEGSRKKLGDRAAVIKARAKEAGALFADLLELIGCSEAEAEQDRAAAAPLLAALFAAVRDFDARFAARKLEHKALEFSDFEHLTLRLLRSPDGTRTALCESIRAGYSAVMVDEYQDTNALQDALYRCLASPEGDNLFFVGDLKQSIYRFRQADPSIFRQKLAAWPPLPGGAARPRPAAGQAGQNALLALDANFRSAPGVVQGVNAVFEHLMTPQLGDTAYGDGQRLVCGVPGEYAGSVEAAVLCQDGAEADAAWIAERIARMVREQEPVRCKEGTRPVRYEDCCILLSTRGHFPVYRDALQALHIPVYADAAEDILDAPHIRPLIALLRIIDNPAQDIYLAAAMLGPVFGFEDDDLVRLRAANKTGSLYGKILYVAGSGEQSGFADRIRAFVARMEVLRRMSRSMPVESLLEEIFVSTGYLAALGAMENGLRRRDDARRFAAFCAERGAGGISALIRAIDATEEAGGLRDSTPGAARPGCVTILTIHRSKGLQFPVVFLGDTGHRFNMDDLKKSVLLHRELGIGLKLRPMPENEAGLAGGGLYATAAHAALSMAALRELRSEQMRLLYVALTRAQDKLLFTVPLAGKNAGEKLGKMAAFLAVGAGEALHSRANSFADWLLSVLLTHPDGGSLRTLAQARELPFADTPSRIALTIQQETPEEETAPEETAPEAEAEAVPEEAAAVEPDPALVAALRAGFGWQYPAAELTAVPAKVSVTSLVHAAEQTTLERPAFLTKDGLSAAEMGTALHAFLEHADFAALAAAGSGPALEEAIEAERQRQLRLQLTAPEIAEKLDQKRLRRFFESEAFARIRQAERVLREYDFITAVPAARVLAVQGSPAGPLAGQAEVLVQGIADLVLLYPDHIELLDYKTDRGKTAADFLQAYRPQLELYALAIEKRFAPLKITYKGIYSFALGRLIQVQ